MSAVITRRQLQEAIEAGIEAAGRYPTFVSGHVAALRAVGTSMDLVARGTFHTLGDDDHLVRCPVAEAFPEWQSEQALPWRVSFTEAFDETTREMTSCGAWIAVLRIEDNERGA